TETSAKIAEQNRQIKELQEQNGKIAELLNQKTASISEKIETNDKSAASRYDDLRNSLNRRALVGGIFVLLFLICSIGLFLWLRRNQCAERTDLETAIADARKSFAEESVRLDSKLTEILTAQLNNKNAPSNANEPDH